MRAVGERGFLVKAELAADLAKLKAETGKTIQVAGRSKLVLSLLHAGVLRGGAMPVLMIAEQPSLDKRTYTSMLKQLMPLPCSANGFVFHAGGPSPAGGTRIIEVWESEADSQKFFNENLKLNLPPGVVPDLKYYELDAAFTR